MKIKIILICVVAFCFIMAAGLAGWLEFALLPLREWYTDTFGENASISVAHESEDYFRKRGTKIDFLFEDIDEIAVGAKEINEYKIKITEKIIDKNYGDVRNNAAFYIEQNIIFEKSESVIKVQVMAKKTQQGNKASYYDTLFAEYRLLPFGTYYIVTASDVGTDNGEIVILSDAGEGDGQMRRKKTKVKAADNPALYDRLLSYGIDRIIDYTAFKGDNISCFEAANIREYSVPDGDMTEWARIYLREYKSKPGGYLMKTEIAADGVKTERKADFYYTGVKVKAPEWEGN